MLDSFDPVSKQLQLMSTIIQYEDIELTAHLERYIHGGRLWLEKFSNNVSRCNIMPYYALSWILTWFSHDLESLDKIARLFDLFVASSPLMPVYVASAVSKNKKEHTYDILFNTCIVRICRSLCFVDAKSSKLMLIYYTL